MKIVSVNLQLLIPDKVSVPMMEEAFEEFIKSKKWEKEAIEVIEDDDLEVMDLLEDEEEEEDNDEHTQNSYY